MLKTTAIALATVAMLGTTAVSAQTIDLGRGAPSIDLRSNKQRERDYQRDNYRREQTRSDRGYDRRDLSTGSVRNGCREVTVRERDDYGNTVTRTRRDC